MIMYYGSKISENISKTPEGYLIARNVPIGRIGTMEYYGEEIGIEEKRGQKVKVYRTPEELFSRSTIASFEGKPVTNDHPSENITLDTITYLTKGHIQNVRVEGDFLIADLFITDSSTILDIENGKREVSSGYDCLWVLQDNGQIEQKNIVGNHVAIVDKGRAGKRVAIKDAEPNLKSKNERSNKNMSILGKMFKSFAKDAEPDEIEKALDEMAGAGESPAQQNKEDNALAEIMKALKGIEERLTALEQSDKQVHKEMGADEELALMDEELEEKEEEASEVVEPEKEAKDGYENTTAQDSMKAFVNKMKPIILAIPDEKKRVEMAKQFRKAVGDSKKTVNGYANILNAVNQNKQKAMDTKPKAMTLEEKTIYMAEQFNKLRGGK